jgi:hypothetical protein
MKGERIMKLTKTQRKVLQYAATNPHGCYAVCATMQCGDWKTKDRSTGQRELNAICKLRDLGLMTDVKFNHSSEVPRHGFRRVFVNEAIGTITDAGRAAVKATE